MTDPQSPLVSEILSVNPHAYEALVVTAPPSAQAAAMLKGVEPGQLLSTPVKSPGAAAAMLAALWLWNDGLEECHRIVQNAPEAALSATYALWHAMMHRREGDFSNSKYWYARCRQHPALQSLAGHAQPVINRAPADKGLLRLIASDWNPDAFVDLVEEVNDRADDSRRSLIVQLQQLEWRVLFQHCTRMA
jgi:hypothetical protein